MHPSLRTLTLAPLSPLFPLSRPARRNISIATYPIRTLGDPTTICDRSLLHSARHRAAQSRTRLLNHIQPLHQRNIALTSSLPEPAKYTQSPPTSGPDFNVVMIGAGNIMFGSSEGPWNHSFRFEHKLGPRLKVVALIDPSLKRAEDALQGKRQSFVEQAYRNTLVFSTIEDYHQHLKTQSNVVDPHAIIVGCPPAYRGGTTKGTDLELKLIKLFPKTAYFIEKPVGTGKVEDSKRVTQHLTDNGNVVSVGYMLRYLRCVQEMKRIIRDNNITIMATNARYSCAYEFIAKIAWWNKALDMGPVIEQGTHFCDLSRYFGGDVDVQSVNAHSIEFYEKPGRLSKVPVDESKIPEEQRIPRLTCAIWQVPIFGSFYPLLRPRRKYTNGAVGSLTHAVALQGHKYDCEFEVWADGYRMRLVDPYNAPTLYVRRPEDDHEERHVFADDDPFFTEVSNFIDCIEDGPDGNILSTFEDATKTYELTWAIRLASEASRVPITPA